VSAVAERLKRVDSLARELILRSDRSLWLPAYLISPVGHNGNTAAQTIRRHPDLWERKMGGAQTNVYRLTALGAEVRSAIELAEAQS
jgi:hypothetical protein